MGEYLRPPLLRLRRRCFFFSLFFAPHFRHSRTWSVSALLLLFQSVPCFLGSQVRTRLRTDLFVCVQSIEDASLRKSLENVGFIHRFHSDNDTFTSILSLASAPLIPFSSLINSLSFIACCNRSKQAVATLGLHVRPLIGTSASLYRPPFVPTDIAEIADCDPVDLRRRVCAACDVHVSVHVVRRV